MSSTFRNLFREYAYATPPAICESTVIILCRGASAQDGIDLAKSHPKTDLIIVNDWEDHFPREMIERGRRSGKTINFLTRLNDRSFRFGEKIPWIHPNEKTARRRYDIDLLRTQRAIHDIDHRLLPLQEKSFDNLWHKNPDTGLRAICYASFFYDRVVVAGLDFWEEEYFINNNLPKYKIKDYVKNTSKKIKKGTKQSPDFIDALCSWMCVTKETKYFYYTYSESFREKSCNIINCSVSNIR